MAERFVRPPIKRTEFITLSPHSTHKTHLKLPRLVFRDGAIGNVISLPPGHYLVHMTYVNRYIGYEVERNGEARYVDVNAWVGQVESDVVALTITP